jgi:polyhydroxybutyrate depolymerase
MVPVRRLTAVLLAVAAGGAFAANAGDAAVTGGAAPPPPPTGACAAPAPAAGDVALAIRSHGIRRTATVHVPAGGDGSAAPLLLAFHGTGRNGRFMERYSGLSRETDRDSAIDVFPDADGPQWNATGRGAPYDVDFMRDLLGAVAQRWCVDPARVTATGVSNGGSFAALLACVMSDRLAGVAIVAGGFDVLPPCHPRRPVSVLEVHGTDDPVVPYRGRDSDGRRGAVLPWVQAWARRDGCPARLRRNILAQRTVRIAWAPCRDRTSVAHIAIFGGMHQWPGATPSDPGPAATISAARVTWGFLQGARRT